ncbi:MAG: hypothetical protein KVP17_004821 [Porospora cf. gigantea B]|uniref:uncharacterized protein n=1 Tax=Porospora cf. gigantea B TaxID=2853592 RepID=UPI0035717BCF|nr:MAG: hypothetical protein KVP17_004821 [Porospora cf. gigantea B]
MTRMKGLHAAWVVPVDSDSERRILTNHVVGVEGDRIVCVLPVEEFRSRYSCEVEWLGDHSCLLPGFVNLHTHLGMSLLRGFGDDMELMSWLHDFIWPAEQKMMSDEFVTLGTSLGLQEMLLTGTTTVNDMYFHEVAGLQQAKLMGVRMHNGHNVLNFGDADAHEMNLKQTEKEIVSTPACYDNLWTYQTCIPHSLYTCSVEDHRRLKKALEHNPAIRYHVHINESDNERDMLHSQHGNDGIAILDQLDLLNDKFIGAHCVRCTDEEIKLMGARKVNVCHCPKSNLKLASGIAPIQAFIEAGCNVGLGTDSCASNNSLSMLDEIQCAALVAKSQTGDARAIRDFTALKMATRNGARALGVLDNIGSLETGKLADMICVDFSDIGCQPVYDPVSTLVYTSGRKVSHVWTGGVQRVRDCKVLEPHMNMDNYRQAVSTLKVLRENILRKLSMGVENL